jgi:hypothetical protein
MKDLEKIKNESLKITTKVKNSVKKQDYKQEQTNIPIAVFPKAIQELVNFSYKDLKFHPDFSLVSILYATSVILGNSHAIKIKSSFIQKGIFYFGLVGKAGTNKSHPLMKFLKPIMDIDYQAHEKYKKEKLQYESDLEQYGLLDRKERKNVPKPELPSKFQLLLSDFTTETIAPIHEVNSRGLGVYVDELATWINNLSRYNANDKTFWLSVWNGQHIKITRRTSGDFYIKECFISVIGTIQPSILANLLSNDTESGFNDRMLFAYPDDLIKEPIKDDFINHDYLDNWNRIVNKIYTLPLPINQESNFVEPQVLEFTPEAKKLVFSFFDQNAKEVNELNDLGQESLASIISKFDIHVLRLALILEALAYGCGESELKNVSTKSIEGAIELSKYFKKTAKKTIMLFSPATKHYVGLATQKKLFYDKLPHEFTKQEALVLNNSMSIGNERTLSNFLNDVRFFEKKSYGQYKKKIIF